jgi:hypothetical protein
MSAEQTIDTACLFVETGLTPAARVFLSTVVSVTETIGVSHRLALIHFEPDDLLQSPIVHTFGNSSAECRRLLSAPQTPAQPQIFNRHRAMRQFLRSAGSPMLFAFFF